jgi:hypothetical protein
MSPVIRQIRTIARHTLPASLRTRIRNGLLREPSRSLEPDKIWNDLPGPSGEAVKFLSPANHEYERERIRQTVLRILAADARDLADRRYLLEAVRSVGIPFNIWSGYEAWQSYLNSSDLGMIQVPMEYVDLLLLLSKHQIRSFCEIGVDFGGFSVLTAAYLSRVCGLQEYHCIDVRQRFVDREFYQEILPLVFHVPATSNDLCGRAFDVVFCDGDHSYWWTKRDFLNLGKSAGIFCLHDIKAHEYDHLDGGVVRFWSEFKQSYRDHCSILEISHSAPTWMGIGVAYMKRNL